LQARSAAHHTSNVGQFLRKRQAGRKILFPGRH